MKATKAEKVQTQEINDKWEVMDGIDDILFKKIIFNIMRCEFELKFNIWRVESALRIEEGQAAQS